MTLNISDDNSLPWVARSVGALLAKGMSRSEIAKYMCVNIRTIHRAVAALRAALDAPGEAETVTPPKLNPVHTDNIARKGDNMSPRTRGGSMVAFQFDEFWKMYPRKIGKKAARAKYLTVLKSVSHDDIMAGLERYCQHLAGNGTAPEFVVHPTTWLNQGRWEDDYKVVVKVQKAQAVCPHCGAPRTGTMSFCPECEEDF